MKSIIWLVGTSVLVSGLMWLARGCGDRDLTAFENWVRTAVAELPKAPADRWPGYTTLGNRSAPLRVEIEGVPTEFAAGEAAALTERVPGWQAMVGDVPFNVGAFVGRRGRDTFEARFVLLPGGLNLGRVLTIDLTAVQGEDGAFRARSVSVTRLAAGVPQAP